MLRLRDHFLIKAPSVCIGVCGCYIKGRRSFHVGVFWIIDDEKKVIHFDGPNRVFIQDMADPYFDNFYFKTVSTFKTDLIYTLVGLSNLIATNSLNTFEINVTDIVYVDGRFDLATGYYLVQNAAERIINCAVFAFALFQTFDHKLVELKSWPPVNAANRSRYLEDWLNSKGVPAEERDSYYQYNKEFRGRELLVSACSKNQGLTYDKAQEWSERFMDYIDKKPPLSKA